jgi:aminopeptidase YwaD
VERGRLGVLRSKAWAAVVALAACASPCAADDVGVRKEAVRAHLEFLASDALRGRGSATHDEELAATYIAARLREFGIAPAGEGGYLQRVPLVERVLAEPPALVFANAGSGDTRLVHGRDLVVIRLGGDSIAGPLQKLDGPAATGVRPGAVVLLRPGTGPGAPDMRSQSLGVLKAGAAAVVLADAPGWSAQWDDFARKLPVLPPRVAGASPELGAWTIVMLGTEAAQTVGALADGTPLRIEAPLKPAAETFTWNVVGILRGRDAVRSKEAVLLSAHLDHLGVGTPVKDDAIYNGANDDASGVVAVLELARAMAADGPARRSLVVALYGSEEEGGLGSTYFREHAPIPLDSLVANLQFEVIGHADPKLGAGVSTLTGYERSDLGPALVAHGARLAADPHPEQHFFERSDNYVLARHGIIAHTVAGDGLYPQYHKPDDDMEHIDIPHTTAVIASLVRPVRWLLESSFTPRWNPGGKP